MAVNLGSSNDYAVVFYRIALKPWFSCYSVLCIYTVFVVTRHKSRVAIW